MYKNIFIKNDMGRLIIDGHDVYEIDERCLEEHKIDKKCEILKKIENAKKENDPKNQRAR